MDVRLTPNQEEFIRQAIAKGRYGRAEDVVGEALAMLEERERKRAQLLDAVDFAEASISRLAIGGSPPQPPALNEPGGKGKRRPRRSKGAAAGRST